MAETLHLASFEGKLDLVQSYIQNSPAAIKSVDEDERTPLHCACSGKRLQVVEYLIASGADVKAKDEESWTPLHIATSTGNLKIVEKLVSAGADVNACNNSNNTPLHYAASKNHADIFEFLLIHNASYTIKNSLGQTPFHRIAANGHLALAEKLLKHVKKNGKSVSDVLNVQDKRENTPLHLAAEEERGDFVVHIIKEYIDELELDLENSEAKLIVDMIKDKKVLGYIKRMMEEHEF